MEAEAMVRLAPIETRRDRLWEHPAVVAWCRLGPATAAPVSLEVLRERRSTAIYRLHGVGHEQSPVIAKRCRSATVAIERRVYEALPQLPVSAPRYYGFSAEGQHFGWLFLEDVGQERYSTGNQEHRKLAGVWLGRMHSFAAGRGLVSGLSDGLPDGGPGRYLAHLRAARHDILANLSNPGLTADDTSLLREIARLHNRLEGAWRSIDECCRAMPATLVHGDFRPKNGYLRNNGNGLELLPIDWEMAGWGVPAADLPDLDLEAYRTASREGWPVRAPALERLARVGQVFRLLAAIGWQTTQLKYTTRRFLEKPMTDLRIFNEGLSRAMDAARL